jgi:hypothetical protein
MYAIKVCTSSLLITSLSSYVMINIDCSNQITFATLILLFLFVTLKRLQPDTPTTSRAAEGKVVVLLIICRTLLLHFKPLWHPNRDCDERKDWNKIHITIVKF